MITLTLGLEGGNLVVVLPGANGTQRTIPLPRGREQELLRVMLQAKQAGEKGIETKAEPTTALAFHTANHRRILVDTCAHCMAEQAAMNNAKVTRYGPRGGLLKGKKQQKKMTMDEMLIAIATMGDEERKALLSDLMKGS